MWAGWGWKIDNITCTHSTRITTPRLQKQAKDEEKLQKERERQAEEEKQRLEKERKAEEER